MYLLRQLLHRLVGAFRACQEKGWRAGFVELGQIVGRVFYQRAGYIVMANVLSGPVPLTNPKPGLVIRQLMTREEIADLSPIVDLADMARFYEMFDCGSVVFAAFQDGQIAGYCWISQEMGRRVNRLQPPLRPGDAYLHDVFVLPAHRNQGIGRALVAHRLQFLREHGYKRSIIAIRMGNTPSLKMNEKMGYVQIGEMCHTRILFWDSFGYRWLHGFIDGQP